MPYSHLKWWRVGSVAVVITYWIGVALAGLDVASALFCVTMPLVVWSTFWRPSSQLVRNAERREEARAPREVRR